VSHCFPGNTAVSTAQLCVFTISNGGDSPIVHDDDLFLPACRSGCCCASYIACPGDDTTFQFFCSRESQAQVALHDSTLAVGTHSKSTTFHFVLPHAPIRCKPPCGRAEGWCVQPLQTCNLLPPAPSGCWPLRLPWCATSAGLRAHRL
jgi:hypothetical protein